MQRTNMATRARGWTAAFLASSLIATATLTGGFARADDKEGPERQAQTSDESPRRMTLEVSRPAPHTISDWEEGEPIPPGYHPVQRVRKGAVVGGAVTFGVFYLISVLIAAAGTDISNANHTSNSAAGLYVPVAGPFITMTQSSSAVGNVFLALDGVAQGAGAALLIYGIAAPRTVLVRNDYGRPLVMPQPMILGRNAGGLGIVGTF